MNPRICGLSLTWALHCFSRMCVCVCVCVRPAIHLQASSNVEAGTLSVRFTQKSGNVYPSAWVGLYDNATRDNSQYRTYEWVSNSVDNTLRFRIPKAGQWEFRYFPQKSYVDVARCNISVAGI